MPVRIRPPSVWQVFPVGVESSDMRGGLVGALHSLDMAAGWLGSVKVDAALIYDQARYDEWCFVVENLLLSLFDVYSALASIEKHRFVSAQSIMEFVSGAQSSASVTPNLCYLTKLPKEKQHLLSAAGKWLLLGEILVQLRRSLADLYMRSTGDIRAKAEALLNVVATLAGPLAQFAAEPGRQTGQAKV